MDHALVFNSSERPRQDSDVECVVMKWNIVRAGLRERNFIFKIAGTINARHAKVVRFKVNACNLPGRRGVFPCKSAIAASYFQYALIGKVHVFMDDLSFKSFRVFLEGHGFRAYRDIDDALTDSSISSLTLASLTLVISSAISPPIKLSHQYF
jgi:hypothetical protein